MTSSEFLAALLGSFGKLLAPVLLVMVVCITVMVAIAALRVTWKSGLGTLIEREDRIAIQEERDWDWLERSEGVALLEREFERKSNLDAVQAADAREDMDEFAELGRVLAEEIRNVAPLDRHSR